MDLLNLQTFLNTVDVSRVQQILVDLVRLPSENPGGTEQQVSEYCKDFLTALGYEVSFVEASSSSMTGLRHYRRPRL